MIFNLLYSKRAMYFHFDHNLIKAPLSGFMNETLTTCLTTTCRFPLLVEVAFCYLHALRQPELQPRGVTCAELSTVMVMVTNRIDLNPMLD